MDHGIDPIAALDADLARLRAAFLEPLRAAPVDALLQAIRTGCSRGFGLWQDPQAAGQHARPATHLFEISFLGQVAVGTTPEEAARNWRRAALAQIDGDADGGEAGE